MAGAGQSDRPGRYSEHPLDLDRRKAICRFLLRLQLAIDAVRMKELPSELARALASNPYHAILLELYLAALEARPIYQSSLSNAGPPANAHRQAARLGDLGAVIRSLDARDHRRMNLALTSEMFGVLDNLMTAVDGTLRNSFPSS